MGPHSELAQGDQNYPHLLLSSFLSAMIRSRYYFAYYLSESINNLAGLGFDGIDADGNHKWDLINNVEIMKVTVVKASPARPNK